MTKRFGGFCNGDKNMWNGIPFRKRPERIVAVWVRGETTQLFTYPGLSFVLIRGHLQSGEKVFYIHIFIFRKYMNSSVWRYQGGSSLYNVFIHTTTCLLDKWPKRKNPLLIFHNSVPFYDCNNYAFWYELPLFLCHKITTYIEAV